MIPPVGVSPYDKWHDRFPVDDSADAPWHELVKRNVGTVRGATVLEVGCGRGGLAHWMERQSPASYVAADFSWSAVSKTASIKSSFVTEQADITNLPHPDRSFDLVISCETIEHVLDPRSAVREMSRVLRPGGRLLLTTPNYMNLMGLYRGYRRVVGRPFTEEGQPINNLTMIPRTMAWVRSAALSPRLVDVSGYHVPFPGRRPFSLTALESFRPGIRWLASHQLIMGIKLQ